MTALSVDIAHRSAQADPLDPSQCAVGDPGVITDPPTTGDPPTTPGPGPILFGDFDADGVSDTIVTRAPDETHDKARVAAYSGADNTLIFVITASSTNETLGHVARPAGDVNADGRDDLLINWVIVTDSTPALVAFIAVEVRSGLDGSLMWRFVDSLQSPSGFGVSAAAVGDVNNDGHDDIGIGSPMSSEADAGAVYLYSGRDGTLIRSHMGPFPMSDFGESIAGLGDVNGDAHADYAISAPSVDPSRAGVVTAFDGASGAPLYTRTGSPDSAYGAHVIAINDFNNNGIADYAIASPRATTRLGLQGRVTVHEGSSGELLQTLTGPQGYIYGAHVQYSVFDEGGNEEPALLVTSLDTDDITDPMLATIQYISLESKSILFSSTLAGLMAPATASADVNHDGVVNPLDLAIILDHFGDYTTTTADVNRDGLHNAHDVSTVIENISTTDPAAVSGVLDGGCDETVGVGSAAAAGYLLACVAICSQFGGYSLLYGPYFYLAAHAACIACQGVGWTGALTAAGTVGVFGCAADFIF